MIVDLPVTELMSHLHPVEFLLGAPEGFERAPLGAMSPFQRPHPQQMQMSHGDPDYDSDDRSLNRAQRRQMEKQRKKKSARGSLLKLIFQPSFKSDTFLAYKCGPALVL